MSEAMTEAERMKEFERLMIHLENAGYSCGSAHTGAQITQAQDRLVNARAALLAHARVRPPVPDSDEREAFEAWAKSKFLNVEMDKDAWGAPRYKHEHIESMWLGFQAARALLAGSASIADKALMEQDAARYRTLVNLPGADRRIWNHVLDSELTSKHDSIGAALDDAALRERLQGSHQ